jgi:OOP family OmpA-OmpF porin
VQGYLVSHGVSASQLTSHGYGKAEPIADNHTAQGRACNRRMAVKVIENPKDVDLKNLSNGC